MIEVTMKRKLDSASLQAIVLAGFAGHITIRIRSLFISTTINPFGFDNEFPPTFCHNHQPLWICSLRIDDEDLGTDKYYFVAEEIGRRVSFATASPTATQTLSLVAYGTDAGVSIFANKFPGVFAATCLSPCNALNARSINNSNGPLSDPEAAGILSSLMGRIDHCNQLSVAHHDLRLAYFGSA
ncbi:hypothetical protein RJ639_004468 [Escallonia herrerae]|uniref:Uncharacterized protein n=1 Tax=Escallonia herrerae TaxID=1293975 RepID=A0AA88W4N0_9ASTE|nr:hypothetical protein RJ639_004468 [Escallonia herrerae]